MPRFIEGKLNAAGHNFGIIVGRFNSFIGERLLDGALDALIRHGADDSRITVLRVPGAFEIPLAALMMARTGTYQAIICLGAVIRGSTPTLTTFPPRSPKGSPTFRWRPAYRSPSAYSPLILSSRRLKGLEQRLVTRGSTLP